MELDASGCPGSLAGQLRIGGLLASCCEPFFVIGLSAPTSLPQLSLSLSLSSSFSVSVKGPVYDTDHVGHCGHHLHPPSPLGPHCSRRVPSLEKQHPVVLANPVVVCRGSSKGTGLDHGVAGERRPPNPTARCLTNAKAPVHQAWRSESLRSPLPLQTVRVLTPDFSWLPPPGKRPLAPGFRLS